jgi:MFS family permease
MQLFRSLTHRPFALLWSGQTISRFGDSLYQVALAWWVLRETGSAAAMGTVFIVSFLPMVLFLLAGGVVVDRLRRVRVMLVSDVARGALVALVAILAARQELSLWHIYAASLAFGLVNAFFQPAYAAVVPQLTPRELLPSANALTDVSAQFAGIAGPILGAFIVNTSGTAPAFGLDALSFVVSAVCLMSLASRDAWPPPTSAVQGHIIHNLHEGLRFVTRTPWLWITIVILSLVNLTGRSPMNIALPFLVTNRLGGDVGMLGLMYSLFALGAVAGAAWLGRRHRIRKRGLLVYGGLAGTGALTLLLGVLPTPFGVGAAICALGLTLALTNLAWANVLQEHVPAGMLGRVSAVNTLGSHVLLPVGFGLTGWATDALGAPLVFVIGGTLTAAMAFIGLATPQIRQLE